MSAGGVPARDVRVAAVVVLEDRAQVTRRGRVTLGAGQQRVVVDHVSPVLVDKTLLARASGARVLDVRCERYVAPWRGSGAAARDAGALADESAAGEALTALEAQAVDARVTHAAARTRVEVARAESEALAAVAEAALADLARAASRGEAAPEAAARLAELDAQAAAAGARAVDAELAATDAGAIVDRLEVRIARALAHAGEDAARIIVELIVDAPAAGAAATTAAELELELGYVVPGAAWRPFHRARLAADQITWETTACVWQATGEDWDDAELTFSLERASLGVAPPDLVDDELHARRRPDTVVVEAREQRQQTTGLGGGAREVPGIDDGGLGLLLRARERVRVRADGAPHRVPVSGFTAPAVVARVAIPLRSPWVHLRARFANAGSAPILAGPVDLVLAAGHVGRAEIGFVAPGERVDLGFGPDADVRIHRDEQRTREDAGLLGGWNVQRVRVALRLSNLGSVAREILVTERVPISEVEQVEVVTSPAGAYTLEEPGAPLVTARAIDEHGLVTWTIALPPRGRRAATLEYKLKSKSGVAGI